MQDLVGTWKLMHVQSRDPEGKPLASQYGPLPVGRIVFTREGRVLVAVTDGRSSLPAGARREYGGYTGDYTFSGTTLTTRVDASPNPALIGTDQIRGVRFEGERMVLHPPPREIGGVLHDRELTWERISAD